MSDKVLQGNVKADTKRKYFALPDLFFAGLIIAAAVFSLLGVFRSNGEGDLVAVVKVSGDVYTEIPLSKVEASYSLTVKGYDLEDVVLYITSESVEFIHSPCDDKLCVNTGKLTKSGESAVCLPQRVSVQLVSADGGQSDKLPDAVAG